MGEKALDVYQGNDWLTYRWSVAQAFDTLDRIRAVCYSASGASFNTVMADSQSEDNGRELFICLIELCDELSGELDTLLADLSLPVPQDMKTRWLGFEMRLHLTDMRMIAFAEHEAFEPSLQALDALLALAARMRDVLRRIDQ